MTALSTPTSKFLAQRIRSMSVPRDGLESDPQIMGRVHVSPWVFRSLLGDPICSKYHFTLILKANSVCSIMDRLSHIFKQTLVNEKFTDTNTVADVFSS